MFKVKGGFLKRLKMEKLAEEKCQKEEEDCSMVKQNWRKHGKFAERTSDTINSKNNNKKIKNDPLG